MVRRGVCEPTSLAGLRAIGLRTSNYSTQLTAVGPIVRVTPDEIHINDVGFLDTVYAPSMVRRDKYEYQLRTLRVPGGVGTTASYDVHKKRREALAPYFSKKNVISLEPVIAKKVSQLCQLVRDQSATDQPVNLSDAFFAFSNEFVAHSRTKTQHAD